MVQFYTFCFGAVRYNVVQFCTVCFGAVWYDLVQFYTVFFGAVWYNVVQFVLVQFGTVLLYGEVVRPWPCLLLLSVKPEGHWPWARPVPFFDASLLKWVCMIYLEKYNWAWARPVPFFDATPTLKSTYKSIIASGPWAYPIPFFDASFLKWVRRD